MPTDLTRRVDVAPANRVSFHSARFWWPFWKKTVRPSISTEIIVAKRRDLIFGHGLLCLCFVPVNLLLSRPDSDPARAAGIGSLVSRYRLGVALMLGISPWYVFLTGLSDTVAGALFYHQGVKSFSEGSDPGRVCLLYEQRHTCYAGRYVLIWVCGTSRMCSATCWSRLPRGWEQLRSEPTGLALDGTIPWSDCWVDGIRMVFRRRHFTLWGCALPTHSRVPKAFGRSCSTAGTGATRRASNTRQSRLSNAAKLEGSASPSPHC